MNALKQLAAAAVLSSAFVGAASPALAGWEVETREGEEFYHLMAHVASGDGAARLELGCFQDPNLLERYIRLGTGVAYDPAASYPAFPRLTLTTGGEAAILMVSPREVDGRIVFDGYMWEEMEALYAIVTQPGPIAVAVLDIDLTFPGGNAPEAVAEVADCWNGR